MKTVTFNHPVHGTIELAESSVLEVLAKIESSKAPTQWAYDRVCEALRERDAKLKELEQELGAIGAGGVNGKLMPGVEEVMESAKWRNALIGLCDTDRIDTPEQAVENIKRRVPRLGSRPLKHAVKAFEDAWENGTQDLGTDFQAAKKTWLLKAQEQAKRSVDWWNRDTASLEGWVNELGALSAHREEMPNWLRAAIKTIYIGLCNHSQGTPVDDKGHPRFLAGYDAGVKDAHRPKPGRPTPMGGLVLKYFELLDRAMELDKSPTAGVHRPKGSPRERIDAWQEVHAVRRKIKEFIDA